MMRRRRVIRSKSWELYKNKMGRNCQEKYKVSGRGLTTRKEILDKLEDAQKTDKSKMQSQLRSLFTILYFKKQ